MERGYINITENDKQEFTVEVKLINGTLWLSVWQMATLFNVYTKAIEHTLKAIFKTGVLRENEVSRIHAFTNDGRESEQILYNLDVLIFVGFRTASFEARAFRDWVLKAFSEYMKEDGKKSQNVLITLDSRLMIPMITSLN